ncbi:MAG: GNAT family N-acetyltransferase [Salinibacterium sp.]|nr:GNAT family N-acetyltransferase [Salinibacterium sp.]
MTQFSPPRALQRGDPVGSFDCGVESLNNWLRTLAIRNQEAGASRTFVTIADDQTIAGYYSLSSFTIIRESAGKIGRGLPDPIPATLIGRLAVDQRFGGAGLGTSLLRDAVERAIRVSLEVGSAVIIAHTRDESVVTFYEKSGFKRLARDYQTLMLPMVDAVVTLQRLSEATE